MTRAQLIASLITSTPDNELAIVFNGPAPVVLGTLPRTTDMRAIRQRADTLMLAGARRAEKISRATVFGRQCVICHG